MLKMDTGQATSKDVARLRRILAPAADEDPSTRVGAINCFGLEAACANMPGGHKP